MAGATINGTTNNSAIQSKVVWSSTSNTSGNYSTVTAKLYYKRDNNYTTYGTWKGSITINGTKTEGSKYIEITSSGWTLALTATTKVTHNANGAKQITISAAGGISGTSMTSTTLSGKATLDTIARKATITSAPNFTDEQNPTVSYSNPAGSAATVAIGIYKTDGSTMLVGYKTANSTAKSFTFSLTTAERTALQNACTTSTSMTVRFYIRTSIGNSFYYHHVEKTLTIANCKPTIAPTAYDTDSIAIGLTGDKTKWIKGYSDVTYNAGLSLKKGATVKSCTVTCGGVKSYNPSGTFGAVKADTITFDIVDSRGQTVSGTYKAPTFIDYFKPTYTISTKTELTSAEKGSYTVTVTGHYYNGSFGLKTNALKTSGFLRINGGAPVAIVGNPMSFVNDPNKFEIVYSETNVPYTNEYQLSFTVDDVLTKAYSQPAISYSKNIKFEPVFDWSEGDFNFNVPVIAEGYHLTGAAKALTNSYNLDTSVSSAGTNWTLNGFTATLLGSNLRCSYDFTRSAATGTGNITNETVMTAAIKHDGKIKAAYPINFTSGGTGGIAVYAITEASNDGQYLVFNINIAATGSAITQSTGQFVIPVVLDLMKY